MGHDNPSSGSLVASQAAASAVADDLAMQTGQGQGGLATAIPRFGRISASLRHFSVRDVREYAPDRKAPCSLSSDSERQRATGHWHPKSGVAGNFRRFSTLRDPRQNK